MKRLNIKLSYLCFIDEKEILMECIKRLSILLLVSGMAYAGSYEERRRLLEEAGTGGLPHGKFSEVTPARPSASVSDVEIRARHEGLSPKEVRDLKRQADDAARKHNEYTDNEKTRFQSLNLVGLARERARLIERPERNVKKLNFIDDLIQKKLVRK